MCSEHFLVPYTHFAFLSILRIVRVDLVDSFYSPGTSSEGFREILACSRLEGIGYFVSLSRHLIFK